MLDNDIDSVIFCQVLDKIYEGAKMGYHRSEVKILYEKPFLYQRKRK
jgi:hypothetical protein